MPFQAEMTIRIPSDIPFYVVTDKGLCPSLFFSPPSSFLLPSPTFPNFLLLLINMFVLVKTIFERLVISSSFTKSTTKFLSSIRIEVPEIFLWFIKRAKLLLDVE